MSNPSVATEQLLELLLTLKKTTPQAARAILNAQPAIAYALITLMVSMNAISIEVFQRTLAEFGGAGPPIQDAAAPVPTISAVPPHLQAQYRGATPPIGPPTHTPTPPYGYSLPPAAAQPPNGGYGGYNGYPVYPAASLPAAQPTVTPGLAEALVNIPPEQKALILRVITMTPDQIKMLPPAERATYIQIRTTLGIPTD
jgi:cleavage stimulation factor subunit 2